mgnify:CR=1 FL=1
MAHQRVRTFTGQWLAVAVLLLASAGWAHADIYSTFGPGDSYDPTWSVSAFNNMPVGFTFSFEGEQSYSLDNVELEMALKLIDGSNKLGVSIMTANADGTPGAVLKSFSFDGLLKLESDTPTGTPVAGGIGGTLEADQMYWLVASIPDNASPGIEVGWHRSSLPLSECSAYMATMEGDSWQIGYSQTSGAFRLTEISPVPVPGAVLLGVLGLGYSSWRLRRRSA